MNYEGPERRTFDQAFERAVIDSAAIAAQRVAKVHRVRLVTQAFIAAFSISLAVVVGGGFIFRGQENSLIHQEAAANCALVKHLSSTLSDFVVRDAQIRRSQAQQAVVARLVADLDKVLPVGDLEAVTKSSNAASIAIAVAWDKDAKKLIKIAETNCSSALP